MLSFKRAMDAGDNRLNFALDRVVSIMLQGISLHSFDYSPPEFAAFQAEIRGLRAGFAEAREEDSALLLAGAAIRALQQHSASAEEFVSLQRKNTHEAIRLLMETLLRVSHASPEGSGILRNLGVQLTESHPAAGAEVVGELAKHLAGICSGAPVPQASETVAKPRSSVDPVTGLRGAGDALEALESARSGGNPVHVFAFCVERLELVNVRFGFAAGDQILAMFAQHIARHLHSEDVFFRWRGPCFLAITQRHARESVLNAEAAKIAAVRLQHLITVGAREIFVPVTGTWSAFKISPETGMEELTRQIDEFAVNRVRTERPVS